MERFDTFYVTDNEYYVPSTAATASTEPKIEEHTIMTVAVVEVVDFGDWTYKHKSIVEDNQVKVERVGKGYKPKNKAILIHHLAMRLFYERNGYASHLLKWIGESFHGHALYVYVIMQPNNENDDASEDDKRIDEIEKENAKKFLLGCKFEMDKTGNNFGLSIVDTNKKCGASLTSAENTIYRTTTSKLQNIVQRYFYGTTKFGKLDKNYVTKICYSHRFREMENFVKFLKSKNMNVLVYDDKVKFAFVEETGKKHASNVHDNEQNKGSKQKELKTKNPDKDIETDSTQEKPELEKNKNE